ncbi:uncharacterized protein B0T15DRAFT_279400 [Chaetomium strumarium]|uniref:Uncharacterized protein n=1 Tax=Chaetomium strumarium TaxID=1170767 RepID=A0AAJ0GP62_9PEZI|nr:hypothetical protein B0T15DRAFT_279400 [Chaetomium strumarium]
MLLVSGRCKPGMSPTPPSYTTCPLQCSLRAQVLLQFILRDLSPTRYRSAALVFTMPDWEDYSTPRVVLAARSEIENQGCRTHGGVGIFQKIVTVSFRGHTSLRLSDKAERNGSVMFSARRRRYVDSIWFNRGPLILNLHWLRARGVTGRWRSSTGDADSLQSRVNPLRRNCPGDSRNVRVRQEAGHWSGNGPGTGTPDTTPRDLI